MKQPVKPASNTSTESRDFKVGVAAAIFCVVTYIIFVFVNLE